MPPQGEHEDAALRGATLSTLCAYDVGPGRPTSTLRRLPPSLIKAHAGRRDGLHRRTLHEHDVRRGTGLLSAREQVQGVADRERATSSDEHQGDFVVGSADLAHCCVEYAATAEGYHGRGSRRRRRLRLRQRDVKSGTACVKGRGRGESSSRASESKQRILAAVVPTPPSEAAKTSFVCVCVSAKTRRCRFCSDIRQTKVTTPTRPSSGDKQMP